MSADKSKARLWTVYRCQFANDQEACGLNGESFDASYDECHHTLNYDDATFVIEAVNSYDRNQAALKAAVALAALIAVADERLLNAAGLAGYKADAAHTNVLTLAREVLRLAGKE